MWKKAQQIGQQTGADPSAASAICSIPPPNLATATREQILAYFLNSWKLEELIFAAITDEQGFFQRGDALRHPLIFYFGHTAAFYINKLVLAGALHQAVHPEFERLFASGVDPEHPGELKELDWPELRLIREFRSRVFECVHELILSQALVLPIAKGSPFWALMMAIEHQRIHFETSSVIMRQLPAAYLSKPQGWDYAPTYGSAPQNELVPVSGGLVSIGKHSAVPIFGWDNEYGVHKEFVPAFRVNRYLVSNAEYAPFVEAGGYHNPAFWSEEGWAWKVRACATHPRFWTKEGLGWGYRTVFERIDMPVDWPVEVNYHEAKAFSIWKGEGLRLPTEAEFRRFSRAGAMAIPDHANLNLKYGSPSPVQLHPSSQFGLSDTAGNVWQWLENDFQPLPGFEPDHLYIDFSAPYFGERHKMMLGGSWITTGTGASAFYRLWFRKNFYQHAGFRLVQAGESNR